MKSDLSERILNGVILFTAACFGCVIGISFLIVVGKILENL
jgi:hypothetical protein